MNAPVAVMVTAVKDPHNVAETLVNGPINLQNMGHLVTLTLTSVRPDGIMQLTPGSTSQPALSAVVVSRVTMPIDVALQLKELLNNTLVPIQLPTKQ